MKVSDMRKALKTAEVAVVFERAHLRTCMNAYLHITTPPKYEGQTYRDPLLTVEAQANDYTIRDQYSTVKRSEEEIKKVPYTYMHLHKLSGFYACHIETEVRLWGHSGNRTTPETAQSFFKVVEGTINTYNLRHKYPDCEVSQILAACELLGARVNLETIEKLDIPTWNRGRTDSPILS